MRTMLKFILTLIFKLILDKTIYCACHICVHKLPSQSIHKFEWIYSHMFNKSNKKYKQKYKKKNQINKQITKQM